MEQRGIFLEDIQLKLLKYSLDEDARVWYKKIPRGSISSLKSFHIAFNHYCKGLYPLNALFEDCCIDFSDEDILEVDDLAEDVCGALIDQNI